MPTGSEPGSFKAWRGDAEERRRQNPAEPGLRRGPETGISMTATSLQNYDDEVNLCGLTLCDGGFGGKSSFDELDHLGDGSFKADEDGAGDDAVADVKLVNPRQGGHRGDVPVR